MKLSVIELRKIIREALEEQGWLPGRWMPTTGEPVSRKDLVKLGHGGFPPPSFNELEELEELEETEDDEES